MIRKIRLAFYLLLIGIAFCSTLVRATDSPALTNSLHFFGRWDLRASDRAITVNSGSYVLAQFTGSLISARFDVSLNKPPFPTLTWRIDNGAWQESEVAATVKLADGLPDGPHTLWLMVRGIDEHQNRWTPPLVASVTFLGLDLGADGKLLPPLAEWDHPKLKMEFLGDSITEGVLVSLPPPGKSTWPWHTNARDSYAGRTAMLLGASWRQVGFGATGLVQGGSGGAPGALNSFNFFYAGCPRDDWQPDVVVINQGTNEGGMQPATYFSHYKDYLALIRQAYPKAKIAALRPFGGFQADSIKQAVDAAHAAGDNDVYYIDSTGWYTTGPLHPDSKASVGLAANLAAALKAAGLAP